MTNKLETSSGSSLLDNKIRIMLGSLNRDFANLDSITKEGVITSFNEVVQKFYETIGKPLFTYRELRRGKMPNITEMNNSFNAAEQDIRTVYEELTSIRKKITSNFNSLSGFSLKLKSDVAMISSELMDYKIQNTNKSVPTFSDRFSDLSKIEIEDKAYDKEKMFVDVANNRVVLPLAGEAQSMKPKRIQIADNSIGTSGNNQEVGVISRSSLELLADNNMDTWFEFEQVSKEKITTPTTLVLKIELEKEGIFNLLEIAPSAFPTGTYPAIAGLSGSVDGSLFFDLMPFYLGNIETDSNGNRVVQLGATPGNPSDSNMLPFSPKKVKYISIKLIEDSSYFIQSPSGIRNRSAIGIKEIKIKSQKYKQEGQIISTNFVSEKEISKISLETLEVLPSGYDTTLKYFTSIDDGKVWEEIGPSQKTSEAPEVLSYNIDFLKDSKRTETPIHGVKLKGEVLLEKSTSSLALGSTAIEQETTEFQNISSSAPSITLKEPPTGIVNLYEIGYGSVGTGPLYTFSSLDIRENDDRVIAKLPPSVFRKGTIEEGQEQIYAEGFEWKRVDDITLFTSSERVYEFDYSNNQATFYKLSPESSVQVTNEADGTTSTEVISEQRHGAKPVSIAFRLKREEAQIERREKDCIINTLFEADGIKDNIKAYKVLEEILIKEIRLRNRASVQRLNVEELQSLEVVKDENSRILVQKDFIDGVLELAVEGDYSVDYVSGTLFLFSPIRNEEEVTIKVAHKEKQEISTTLKEGSITIEDEDYQTIEESFSQVIEGQTYVLDLGHRNIERGTLQFSEVPETVETEVPFDTVEESFSNPLISNPYAVDYRRGLLFVKHPTEGLVKGILSRGNYYVEYRVAKKIAQTDYSVDRETSILTFTDAYISGSYVQTQNNENTASGFYRIEYKYAEEIEEPSGEMLQYTTPILKQYKIKTIPKGSLL